MECCNMKLNADSKDPEKMRTLLIDDDELIRDSFSMVFKTKHCPLLAVDNAETGLQVLKENCFDTIICDYRLPGMNGLEFYKEIRVPHPDIFKILITAYGDNGMSLKASEAGVHRIIKKPFSIEEIIESLGLRFKRNKKGNT